MKVKIAQNSYRTTTLPISIQTKPKQRLKTHFSPPKFTKCEITFISFCLGFHPLEPLKVGFTHKILARNKSCVFLGSIRLGDIFTGCNLT